MTFLLNGLYLLFLAIGSPWILWRCWKQGRYRQGWTDKFFGLSYYPQSSQTTVWLHAVSVGEVQVLRTLVEKFELERPDLKLAISVTTDSGMVLAKKIFSQHFLFFTPFDFTWSIKKTLRVLQPKFIVLAELEIWPNWLLQAEKMGCPVFIINGRLSERSFLGYGRIPYLVRACMQSIDWVGAQSATYAKRFEKLGVEASKITVTGNVKFDGANGDRCSKDVLARRQLLRLPTLPAPLAAIAFNPPPPPVLCVHQPTALAAVCDSNPPTIVFLAGSTQSPEESIVLSAFTQLADRLPHLKLIIVPRHPERFDQVAELIKTTGLPWARRSNSQKEVSEPNWRIFLGDSVGELQWWWGLADIGFVGGSFGDRGGQNMIEPCAYGVATCFGPNTRNFADIVKLLLDDNATTQLQTPNELLPWIDGMLADPAKRIEMASRAIDVCQRHRGAVQRTWTRVEQLSQLFPP